VSVGPREGSARAEVFRATATSRRLKVNTQEFTTMKCNTATPASADDLAKRLAPILKDDLSVDMVELGRIEQKDRVGEALTSDEQTVLEAVLDHPLGARMLSSAARQYIEYLDRQVREHGGTIVTHRVRYRDGRRTSERRVERFPATRRGGAPTAERRAVARSTPRARGAGRPKGQSTRSSARSGDSGDDGPSDEPPSRRRLCAFCGRDIHRATQAKYCSDKHADADRQRRKRQRQRERNLRPRVPTTADEWRMSTFEVGGYERLLKFATCRCNGHHILDRDEELGHRCIQCGRQRPESALGMRSLMRLRAVVA
jgi:hypothetical protein